MFLFSLCFSFLSRRDSLGFQMFLNLWNDFASEEHLQLYKNHQSSGWGLDRVLETQTLRRMEPDYHLNSWLNRLMEQKLTVMAAMSVEVCKVTVVYQPLHLTPRGHVHFQHFSLFIGQQCKCVFGQCTSQVWTCANVMWGRKTACVLWMIMMWERWALCAPWMAVMSHN